VGQTTRDVNEIAVGIAYSANLPASLVGLEACVGAHFLGTALREQGHQVRLIPAQFVKPYRKSNKNDFLDAEAIAEAVTKQNMRSAQLKTQEQLDGQAMHRVRDRLVRRRTALINEIRGFLLERGITFAAQPIHLRKNLPTAIEDAEQNLSSRLRWLLDRMWQEWKQTETEIQAITEEIERISNEDARCRQLRQIPGFGPLVSTWPPSAMFQRRREKGEFLAAVKQLAAVHPAFVGVLRPCHRGQTKEQSQTSVQLDMRNREQLALRPTPLCLRVSPERCRSIASMSFPSQSRAAEGRSREAPNRH
jgi:hypothetical protein